MRVVNIPTYDAACYRLTAVGADVTRTAIGGDDKTVGALGG